MDKVRVEDAVGMVLCHDITQIIPGVDGLIHISQIADHRIAKAEEALTIGQEVEAKIIDINDEKKKVSLSIRALLEGNDVEETEESEEA